MYGRKLKVKKKSKTGIKSNDGGSNWGPRVALYEREREQATHQQYLQKQQLLHQQQHHNQALTSSSASVSNSATYSSHYGLQQDKYSSKQQLLRLKEQKENNDSGIVPSSINSHYSGSSSSNYHQRTIPINLPLPTSAPPRPGNKTPSTPTTGNNNNNGNLSKPLTVIIPPPEHFPLESDFGPDRNSSIPSTKTWRSSPDHQHDIDHESDTERGHTSRIPPPPEFGKNSKQQQHSQGPLSPTVIIVDSPLKSKPKTTEDNTIDRMSEKRQVKSNENADESSNALSQMNHFILEATPEKVSGAAISALAQGLAMVYVPMESTPVPGPSSMSKQHPQKKTAEQQAVENLDDVIDSISRSVSRSSTTGSCTYSIEQMDEPAKMENKPLLQTVTLLREKESEMDSLLESFDSVMFKPKPNAMTGINPGICGNAFNNNNNCNNSSASTNSPSSSSSDSGSTKGYENTRLEVLDSSGAATGPPPPPVRVKQQISESPPPLPPPNIKPKKPDKNLRFSEQLENIHQHQSPFHRPKLPRLGKKVSIPTTPETQSQHSQQDTQSVTTEVADLKRFNTMSTGHASESSFPTVLSCGHMKTSSNYSTLSSVTSSLTDDDHDDRNTNKRESRSAIQQLRDLSILIGGGQNHQNNNNNNSNSTPPAVPTTITNNKDKVKSEKHRRDSQGSSGTDSGKGSGSSPTETSPKANKTSYGIPCAFGKSDCDDCYKVFKNPLAIDSSCSHSSGTSPLSSQDRCENYHRHLIIQEQSRLKHSAGKSSRSHNNLSSQGSSSGSSTGTGGWKKSKKSKKNKKTHQLVFEYCDCRHCDCSAHRTSLPEGQLSLISKSKKINHQDHQVVGRHKNNNVGLKSNNDILNMMPNGSNANGGGGTSASRTKRSPGNSSSGNDSHQNNSNLFTIDEEEIGEVGDFTANPNTNQMQTFMDEAGKDLNSDEMSKDHWHPKCWLATDATMGWSDLESLYSQNVKLDKPMNINDECWTCWKEIAENRKFTGQDANRTVDRTKRMFIWLNKRHKEFNAPWWEAKKQASIRWLITKSFAHLPKESIGDPFKETKKGKPKYRLKDEVIKGLVNGKLYCLALDHLYQNQHYRSGGLTHWDIIKILSRRGVYVAQPSDMKLTEGTLRQKKPLRIAAHIALIEAIMGLYCKETLNRDRILATLNSFGQTIDPDSSSAEELLIAWINAAMLALKSYIISNTKSQKLPCDRLNRWLSVPQVHEIRDLCDGVGICSLFALYCSNDVQVGEIAVPEPDDMLNIYETIANHSIIERLCHDIFPETVYHLRITDFLYIHGYMKQNILCFLVDLFNHLEMNPVIRVNRLTHVPIRIEL